MNKFSFEIFKFGGKINRSKFFINCFYLMICCLIFIGLAFWKIKNSKIYYEELVIGILGITILYINLMYRRLKDIFDSKKYAIIFLILFFIAIPLLNSIDRFLSHVLIFIVPQFLFFKKSKEEIE